MNLKLVQSSLTRRIVVPVIAAGALIAGGAWSLARPANAAAPAAAPLDESSVGPLRRWKRSLPASPPRS